MNIILSALLSLSLLVTTGFAAPTPAPTATPPTIELSTGTATNKEAIVFSRTTLTVKAGSLVSLLFKNGATVKGSRYNFVLVKPGKAQSMVDASMSAGAEKGWVAGSAEILAHSKLVDAGESVTISFTAPAEPGDYPYICTVPGHATMKGVLKVTK